MTALRVLTQYVTASIHRHLRGQTTSIFRMTELCLGRSCGLQGSRWVGDTGRQQAIWPIRTTEMLKADRPYSKPTPE